MFQIVAGDHDVAKEEEGEFHSRICDSKLHPGYVGGGGSPKNDIALIKASSSSWSQSTLFFFIF
jgi:hypothetical protein